MSTSNTTCITVNNLTYSYDNETVLNNISFDIPSGCLVSLLGPNGVGKSTLFKCILGIFNPQNGQVYINNLNVQDLTPRKLAQNIAYIPQSHNNAFNYSVFDIVLMGTTAKLDGYKSPGKQEIQQVEEALKKLNIYELRNRGFSNISGGERQLALIARALVQQAKIIIMDEPTSNLDFGNRIRVMNTIKSLTHQGYTIILSTHEPDVAFMYSDRILCLLKGNLLAYGTPAEIITPDIISSLYNVDVDIVSLREDHIRVCLPKQ